ncbi:ComEA family DNA-binding protein [Corynebacterium pilosum]|uniref:DNA uptake protein or related DNA-binding protein n=1 Tax=Corynebacterium pilosum TaxID=35756 RepID=A0A376CK95_9CORY|nr:ComEA family DNA-binding protein [Corynebacterium pilosum]STC68617.1 DNA uptake protein or related DNA-binding protein [Corynebacterium pilosum]
MDITQRISELTRPTGEEDLLNVNYPKSRVEISTKHAVIAALVAVVGLVSWVILGPNQTGPPGGQGPPDSQSQLALADPAWATAANHTGAPAAAPESVVVSVVGAVDHPGLVTLAPGARVADALDSAGAQPEADMMALNLAQVLMDGQQIVVTRIGEAPPAPPPGGGSGTQGVSLNSASAAELMELPGVGEATAAAIISHREEIGGFSDIAQLQDVSGIGPAKFAKLQGEVVL